MTTIVADKNGQVNIAADPLTVLGTGLPGAVWDKTAADVARAGVGAGIEFDRSSAGPCELHTMKRKRGYR